MGYIRKGLRDTGKSIKNMNKSVKNKRRGNKTPRGSRRKGGNRGLGRL
jgi:hypothetical protein